MNIQPQSSRLITCILPVGTARAVLELLKNQKRVTTAYIYHARGIGASHQLRSSLAEQLEKDILVVLVPKKRAEEVFNYLYEVTGIYQPHHGLMYMEKVAKTMTTELENWNE